MSGSASTTRRASPPARAEAMAGAGPTPRKRRAPALRRLIWRVQDALVRLFLGLLALLPWRARLAVAGWLAAHVLGPLFGAHRRIRANLALVRPELPPAEVTRLCRAVSANAARTMIEHLQPEPFLRHARRAALEGPGVPALLEALETGRRVVLVSGHFGNYQVPRVLLAARGRASAGVYRPMNNPYTDARYVAALNRIAAPNFPRGRRGTMALLRHLRDAGAIALLNDQAMREGQPVPFFGRPALTMTSAAEMALKHDALLIPCYGVRAANGVDFTAFFDTPVPPGDATRMTALLNASLERMVRAHPGQWFWMHRRWKFAEGDTGGADARPDTGGQS